MDSVSILFADKTNILLAGSANRLLVVSVGEPDAHTTHLRITDASLYC